MEQIKYREAAQMNNDYVADPVGTCAAARQPLHPYSTGTPVLELQFGTAARDEQYLLHCRNLCLHLTGAAYIQMPAGPWL